MDADAYYDSPRGRYMAYNNTVRDYVATLEQAMGPMVPLKKHLLAVAFQLAALRDAFAVAWCARPCSQHPRQAALCSLIWVVAGTAVGVLWPQATTLLAMLKAHLYFLSVPDSESL